MDLVFSKKNVIARGAALHGRKEVLEKMLEEGANDYAGIAKMIGRGGDWSMIEALYSYVPQVDKSKIRDIIIYEASYNGNDKALRDIIKFYNHYSTRSKDVISTSVIEKIAEYGAMGGHHSIVKYAISLIPNDKKYAIESLSVKACTGAAIGGKISIIDMLSNELDHRGIARKDVRGIDNAFSKAIIHGHIDIVKYFIVEYDFLPGPYYISKYVELAMRYEYIDMAKEIIKMDLTTKNTSSLVDDVVKRLEVKDSSNTLQDVKNYQELLDWMIDQGIATQPLV